MIPRVKKRANDDDGKMNEDLRSSSDFKAYHWRERDEGGREEDRKERNAEEGNEGEMEKEWEEGEGIIEEGKERERKRECEGFYDNFILEFCKFISPTYPDRKPYLYFTNKFLKLKQAN